MIKYLVLIVALLSPMVSYAGCAIDHQRGLSDEQMAKLRIACETAMLETASATPIVDGLSNVDLTDPESLTKWGAVAKEWAGALGIAAKELGIAANEFLGTTAGKLTAFIILWQIMGDTMLGIIIGVPLLITIIIVGTTIARRARVASIVYGEPTTGRWFKRKTIKEIVYKSDEEAAVTWVAYIATVILSVATLLIIF